MTPSRTPHKPIRQIHTTSIHTRTRPFLTSAPTRAGQDRPHLLLECLYILQGLLAEGYIGYNRVLRHVYEAVDDGGELARDELADGEAVGGWRGIDDVFDVR
jgi:hypothetical protein